MRIVIMKLINKLCSRCIDTDTHVGISDIRDRYIYCAVVFVFVSIA